MPKKKTARKSKPRMVCIPASQAKALNIKAPAKPMNVGSILRTEAGRSYLRTKKAFQAELKSPHNSSCALLRSAAGKFADRAAKLAKVAEPHLGKRRAGHYDTESRGASKKAEIACGKIMRRLKGTQNRYKRVEGLKGRR
jgi:hypothetical protein